MSIKIIKKIKENLNDDFINTLISIMNAGINNSKLKLTIPTKNGVIIRYVDGTCYKISCFPTIDDIESIVLEMNNKDSSEIYNVNYISEYEKILRKTIIIDKKIIKRTQIYNYDVLTSEVCEIYEEEKLINKIEIFKNYDNIIYFKEVSFEDVEKIWFKKSYLKLVPYYNDFAHLFLMDNTDMNKYDYIIRNLDDERFTEKIDVMEYYNEYNVFIKEANKKFRTRI